MTYRELIELYKNGKLEEKQKEMVKNDIERHEAISEYLFVEGEIPRIEDLERDYFKNELLDNSNMDNQEEEVRLFSKMIKSSIRNAFIKMGVIVGAIVLAIIMFIIFAVPQILNLFYYNPAKVVDKQGELETNRITLDLATYSELFLPGYYRDSVMVDSNGYGNYDINIIQTSSYSGLFTNVAGKIEKGKMTLYDANLLKKPTGNAFIPDCTDLRASYVGDGAAGSYSDAMKKLQELDENQFYLAYVTLEKIKKYSQFVEWCTKEEVNPDWCAICLKDNEGYYTPNTLFGFIYKSSCGSMSYDKDTYPYLTTFDASTTTREDKNWAVSEDIMTTHVVSMLRYMAKQASFNKMMGHDNLLEYLNVADNVESNGLNLYGFAIVAKKSDLLNISKADGVAYIYTTPMKVY